MTQLKLETFQVGSFACNCSLVYDEETKEAIIIDPGNDLQGILTQIRERDLQVQLLLHTHAHFDHIGCAKCLRDELTKDNKGPQILLHKDDELLYQALPEQARMFNRPPSEAGKVDIYLEDQMEFCLENSSLKNFLKTIFTPGHTEGSCCFYTEAFSGPVLFSGDTLFQNSIGRTDLPGGDFDEIKRSIKQKLYLLPDETQVITGHGPPTLIYNEKKHNPFVTL